MAIENRENIQINKLVGEINKEHLVEAGHIKYKGEIYFIAIHTPSGNYIIHNALNPDEKWSVELKSIIAFIYQTEEIQKALVLKSRNTL